MRNVKEIKDALIELVKEQGLHPDVDKVDYLHNELLHAEIYEKLEKIEDRIKRLKCS